MVTLLNEYYRIDRQVAENDGAFLFSITLLAEFHAYAGHFPDNPVAPGVCNIQLIKECAEQLVGKRLFLAFIAKCRFSAVLIPKPSPHVQLRMRLMDGTRNVIATLFDDTTTYIEFKGEFTVIR